MCIIYLFKSFYRPGEKHANSRRSIKLINQDEMTYQTDPSSSFGFHCHQIISFKYLPPKSFSLKTLLIYLSCMRWSFFFPGETNTLLIRHIILAYENFKQHQIDIFILHVSKFAKRDIQTDRQINFEISSKKRKK